MHNKDIIKRSYLHGIVLFTILAAISIIMEVFGFSWAKRPYEAILILLLSCVVSFSERIIKIRNKSIYKKNRFLFLMIGVISSITVISYVRDIMNNTVKIIKNGLLTEETCIGIIGIMFLCLFFAYLYKEFKTGEEMNSR